MIHSYCPPDPRLEDPAALSFQAHQFDPCLPSSEAGEYIPILASKLKLDDIFIQSISHSVSIESE